MARNGSIAFYLGEFELSKECLKEALLRQPNLSIPWLLLGKIYAGKGELEKSDLCFKRYNILMKGVFSLSSYDVTNLDLFGEEQKYLEVDYSSKFQDWYRSKLLY